MTGGARSRQSRRAAVARLGIDVGFGFEQHAHDATHAAACSVIQGRGSGGGLGVDIGPMCNEKLSDLTGDSIDIVIAQNGGIVNVAAGAVVDVGAGLGAVVAAATAVTIVVIIVVVFVVVVANVGDLLPLVPLLLLFLGLRGA